MNNQKQLGGLVSRILLPLLIANVAGLALLALLLPKQVSGGTIVLILAAYVLVQLGVTWLVLRQRAVGRLSALQEYLDLVVSTEKAPKAPLQDSGEDEIGRIVTTLVDFVENLRDVMGQVRAGAQQVRQSSEQQAELMEDSVASVESRTTRITEVAVSIDAVANTSASLTDTAEQMTDTTRRVVDLLSQGKQSSGANQQAVKDLVTDVDAMQDNLARLQEESARIGSVLDVIRGIAEQTNLLALNAAIEAARAGEQGRGFAVVADEVRALAHRTQESTVEIQNMVEGLQTRSETAVAAMKRSRTLSDNSLEQSCQVAEVFQQIHAVVTEVYELTSRIADGTSEQSASTASINERMSQLAVQGRDICNSLSIISDQANTQEQTARQVDTTLNRICV